MPKLVKHCYETFIIEFQYEKKLKQISARIFTEDIFNLSFDLYYDVKTLLLNVCDFHFTYKMCKMVETPETKITLIRIAARITMKIIINNNKVKMNKNKNKKGVKN